MKIQNLFKNEIQKINELETEKKYIEIDIANDLTDADNVCEKCEEIFGFEDEKTIKAYEKYEHIRMPLTEIESRILQAKRELADAYINILKDIDFEKALQVENITQSVVCVEVIADTIISA